MVITLEILMILAGLGALVSGKFPLTRNRVVYGAGARLLGLILFLPFVLAFCYGFAIGFDAAIHGRPVDQAAVKATIKAWGPWPSFFSCALACFLGLLMSRPQRRPAPYRQELLDVFLPSVPSRPGNGAESFQAAVPLSTLAHVRCQTPRRCEEVQRPAPPSGDRGLWIALVLLFIVVLLPVVIALLSGGLLSLEASGDQAAVGQAKDVEPAEIAPPLLKAGARVYLSDLPEFGWKGADGWTFGKAGCLGNLAQPEATIVVQSRRPAKALSMQPPRVGHASVRYYLGRRAQTLDFKVCLSTDHEQTKLNPTRFEVFGDGQQLWRSPVIANVGEARGFSGLDVSQVNVLELRTSVESDDGHAAHAIWLNPFVEVKEAKVIPPRPS